MKDEIKEILDNLVVNETTGMCYLSIKLTKQIKDCITNLQTIEQQYSAILSENAELENKITNLQENYEKEHYLVDKLTRQLNDEYKNTEYQCKQKEVYKSRNEKAIEYIENDMPFLEEPDDDYENTHKMIEYDKSILINILNGDKDE